MMQDNNIFTILIVDDLPKNLQVLGSILKEQGYQVEFATNGIQAIEWLKEKEFDLILLDIMMPEMDGFEVCKRVRAGEPNKNVPIIFLTAKTDKESVLKGYELGAQDYVTKPFDSRELLARVKTQIELKAAREELEQMNQVLEKKVEERTQELAITNKKLEKYNDELVDMDAAKSEFLNIVSQKIRKPLANVMATIDVLKNKLETKELFDLMKNLDDSVEELEKFTSIAVQITAFRTKKQKLDLEKIHIQEVLEYSFLEASKSIKKNQIKFDYSKITDELYVMGDYDLLMICFKYLLEKLAEASGTRDSIVVTEINRENKVGCSYLNTGEGFSMEFMQLITILTSNETSIATSVESWELLLANLILEAHSGRLESIPEKNEILMVFKINS